MQEIITADILVALRTESLVAVLECRLAVSLGALEASEGEAVEAALYP